MDVFNKIRGKIVRDYLCLENDREKITVYQAKGEPNF